MERARALAAEPFAPPDEALPEVLRALDEARYQAIRFRPELALWREPDLNAEAQFFHLRHRFRMPCASTSASARAQCSTSGCSLRRPRLAAELPEISFRRFPAHAPLNRPDHHDEWRCFSGAKLFPRRLAQPALRIWARGVAIDTGLPKVEEFPAFRRFWLERPEPGAAQLVVYALLDGPSVSGAYTFRVRPGNMTTIEVEATLFARDSSSCSVAPLTSMFLFVPTTCVASTIPARASIVRTASRSGRAPTNGCGVRWSIRSSCACLCSALGDQGLRLLQRPRDFAAYQDLEARYDQRPSLWVEPLEAWGDGHVRLIEIPSPSEIYDNMVAFWVPKEPVQARSGRCCATGSIGARSRRSRPTSGRPSPPASAAAAAGDLQAETDLRRS